LETGDAGAASWKAAGVGAAEEGGCSVGRGGSDWRGLTAINLMTMVLLKRSGAVLDRDVIMLATADEEAGSGAGLAWLVQNKWGDFNPGFALNEGGGVVLNEKGAPALVFVESAEKMYLDLKLTASGTGGHPSIPYASNAIYSLAGALASLEKRKMPIHVTPAAEKFFRSVYSLQNEDGRTTFDMFFSTDAKKSALAAEAIAEDPFFNSQLRDTAVPTVVCAGQDNNVVPSEAWAVLNCRLLYDTDVDAFIEQIRTVAAAHGVKTTVLERPRQPFPQAMPLDDELYAAIARVSARLMPGAVVAAGMIPATTDSEFLRRAGVIAYGLGSPKTYGEMYDAHSPDEKIRLDSFYSYFDLTYNIVRSLAVPRQ
ncbi:MAG: M20/M25/M40 family metallo-hydrolase, partial [Elusimicrobiaceae bacterium]